MAVKADITIDIDKQVGELQNLSQIYNARVGDDKTPLTIAWRKNDLPLNLKGLHAFIVGKTGDGSYNNETGKIDFPVGSPVSQFEDDGSGTLDGGQSGLTTLLIPKQMWQKSGIFAGYIGLKSEDGSVFTSKDIWFKVLGNVLDAGVEINYFISDFDKILSNAQRQLDQVTYDLKGKSDQTLADLRQEIKTYLLQYENAVEDDKAALKRLSAVASSIDSELQAADITTKQEFDQLKKDIVNKLTQMQLQPILVTDLASLQNNYPKGALGIFVTATDGCLAYFVDGKWQKGARFQGIGLTNQNIKLLSEANDISKALLEKNNSKLLYSYHINEDISGTGWADSNYIRVCQLAKGMSQFIITLKSETSSHPVALITELQSDNSYIAKSAIPLKEGTGETESNLINYLVKNDNTYLFIGGSDHSVVWDYNDSENKLIQLSDGIVFNTPTKLHIDVSDNVSCRGVNVTVIGFKQNNIPIKSDCNNIYTYALTANIPNHYWNIATFSKDEFLTKARFKSNDTEIKVEIRELIDGKYVLKKKASGYQGDDGNIIVNLNYLTENTGIIFASGKFNYTLDDMGNMYEYDETPEAVTLTPTLGVHQLIAAADIFKLKNTNSVSDIANLIKEEAADTIYNQIFWKYNDSVLDNSNTNDAVSFTNPEAMPDHYWNLTNFKKGAYLSTAVLPADDEGIKIEIRELINGEYVLIKRCTGIKMSDGKIQVKLNYHAQNDGTLFISGKVKYILGDGNLLEYNQTDSSIMLTPTPNAKGIKCIVTIYSDSSLIDKFGEQIVQQAVQQAKLNSSILTINNLKTDLQDNMKLLPRFVSDSNKFSLLGRWYQKQIDNKKYYVTNNNGAQINYRIKNASYFNIDWKQMHDPDYARWAYSIDGQEFQSISTQITQVNISNKENHIVRIVTDAIYQDLNKWGGNGFAFSDVTTDGTITGLIDVDPIIMYFGDSITEGIRTLGMDEKGPGCSVLHAYSWISSQYLHAHPYLIGYGGTGLVNSGSFNTTDYSVDWMTQGISEKDINPNLIVINVGTNDGAATDDQFGEKYKSLLNKLILRYPGVPIMCMIPFNQTRANVISKIVTNAQDCYLVETKDWQINGTNTTDGTHPNEKGSNIAGFNLAIAIKKKLSEKWMNNTIFERAMKIN